MENEESGVVTREVTLEGVCVNLGGSVYCTGKAVANVKYDKSNLREMIVAGNEVTFFNGDQVMHLISTDTLYYEYNGYDDCLRRRILGNMRKYIMCKLRNELGETGFERCNETGLYDDREHMHCINGKYYLDDICCVTDFGTYLYKDVVPAEYYDSNGRGHYCFPKSMLEEAVLCPRCGAYSHPDWYSVEDGLCWSCALQKYDGVIESYGSSHEHNDNPVFFGEKHNGIFAGLGFELEVETSPDYRQFEGKVAYNLIPFCSFEPNELRYAHDGSLNYGFEIISEPHTVKDFWSKTDKWCEMLDYLKRNHYTSHKSGRCGLHIHVSRAMFGKTKEQQNKAIAKILAFYHDNFEELQTISRRADLEYCGENYWAYTNPSGYKKNVPNKYRRWKTSVDEHTEGIDNHYCAINNSNKNTVEFRLGRGTLNSLSFLAWIDLTLTLVKNAKRISYEKLDSNDRVAWLAGIKKETARYCLSRRGSFASAIYELYPELKWDTNNEAE